MDVLLFESGSGGQFNIKGNDLETTSGVFQQIYLALFGGNVEASTGQIAEGQQSFDWWGNTLLLPDQPEAQFNSLTERMLNTTALTSIERVNIESAVNSDLEYLSSLGKITTTVTINDHSRISIFIRIQQPEGQQEQRFTFIWDATRVETIETRTI